MKIREKTNLDICNDNDLKLAILTNVVEEKTTKNQIRATMQLIAKALCGTLGPYGSTSILEDQGLKHHLVTKDGYDLLTRMTFDNEISRTILDILKSISSSQVSTVGDGSTSAIVVASSLYEAITDPANKEMLSKVASKDIVDMLNYLAEILEEELKKAAKPISEDLHELDTVGAIAVNNDKECGKMVADIYRKIGKYGFITTDAVEQIQKDTVEYKEGIQWKRPYLEDYFAINIPSKKVVHEEPYLFLTTEVLTQNHLQLLMDVIGYAARESRPLLIVCCGADQDARTFFKKNRLKHLAMSDRKTPELVFTVVDIDTVTETSKATLRNLALLTGCEIYSPVEHAEHTHPYFLAHQKQFYGKAAKVIVTPKETQVICDTSLIPEEYDVIRKAKEEELLKQINNALSKTDRTMDDEKEIYYLKYEYNSLLGNSAVLHVGGQTLTERMSRERLLEDAVLACRSAINYGTIYGGNLAIPKIIYDKFDYILNLLYTKFNYLPFKTDEEKEKFFTYFLNIFQDAFKQSYRHVLDNSYFNEQEVEDVVDRCIKESVFYNLKTHKYEGMSETGVINSVDTDTQILKACISIIGLLATSNQVVISSYCTLDAIKQ
jgi:chaperonin GroEL